MPIKTISLKRSITSYSKVQKLVGAVIRSRRFQVQRKRTIGLRYLDVGCGPNTHCEFINLDFLWHSKVDVCWDISRGLPFPDNSMQGIYSEHCLEHFGLVQALALLKEFRRLMAPGGIVRIAVPDAELYLRLYVSHIDGNTEPKFPYSEIESFQGFWCPMLSVNRVFYQDRDSSSGHKVMYDYALLRALLRQAGFNWVEKSEFGQGQNPVLLIDSPQRQMESLYVEAGVNS